MFFKILRLSCCFHTYHFSWICLRAPFPPTEELQHCLRGTNLCICLLLLTRDKLHIFFGLRLSSLQWTEQVDEQRGKTGWLILSGIDPIFQSSKFSASFPLFIIALCYLKDTVEIAMGTQRKKEHTPWG